ncbi:MAG: type II toxin-antitoxin system VapC family toxin [Candidatus Eremiobacterota bacterium]
MNGRFLLDTNIIIALFNNEPSVMEKLLQAKEVFIPSIVCGELYYGANKSVQVTKNLERIDLLASIITVLTCNINTAKEYGLIKDLLRKKGKPVPENDIWIASIAKQYELTLVTRDKHFEEMENLRLEIW